MTQASCHFLPFRNLSWLAAPDPPDRRLFGAPAKPPYILEQSGQWPGAVEQDFPQPHPCAGAEVPTTASGLSKMKPEPSPPGA